MILREELFEQKDGLGLLELRGGELDLALLINGQPLAYDALDCGGSVGRFTALLPDPPDIPIVQDVELNAQKGFEGDVPLSQQVGPLLQLLPNGPYQLTLTNPENWVVTDWDDQSIETRGRALGYYPWGSHQERVKVLIPTQLSSALRDERINFYLREIEQDSHPAMIAVGSKNHDAVFILDGHHKMMAFWCCGVGLRVLLIEFQTLSPISNALARSTLGQITPTWNEYLKWKEHREQSLFRKIASRRGT